MNERPSTTGFVREGFVEENPAARAPAPAPAPQVEAKPLPPTMPPPELQPSPAEQDRPDITLETWPIVVRLLYKPLAIPGGPTYNELSFREPRGGDINRYGNPCRVNADGEVIIEERKMHYIMGALSGILPPYLDMLDPRDWNSCAYRLRGLFAPDPRSWSSATTTP